MAVDSFLLKRLVCPRHRVTLSDSGSCLSCPEGHQYPAVDGIPILIDEGAQTIWTAEKSLKHGWHREEYEKTDPYHLGTMVSQPERDRFQDLLSRAEGVDPVVSLLVAATNGIAYTHLIGNLKDYPIPQLRLPPGNGELLLDIGCNWGRWSIAAARLGYRPIGIDPSLGAVLAARRVATQLGLDIRFVVGDARCLPFPRGCFDTVFSYSVIQHFSREDALKTIQEIGRTLQPRGKCLIQMPTPFGLRCLYHQARRGFRQTCGFDVRYWTLPALRRAFGQYVGRTSFSVDCFFGIGLQSSDLQFMPPLYRAVIRASELLRAGCRVAPWLRYVADSVYVESIKAAQA
jgi:SAM-dependent methyltransferase